MHVADYGDGHMVCVTVVVMWSCISDDVSLV